MKRRLAWLGLGLGLTPWACGRATRNPEPAPVLAEGGCASDCGSGGAPASDAAGGPSEAAASGSFSAAGTFSSNPGAAGEAGAGNEVVTPPSCTPGAAAVCAGRKLYECGATGAVLRDDCGAQAHCYADAGGAMCVPDLCVQGQTTCINNVIKACGDSGVYPETGTDCGNQACSGSTCQPKICEPNSHFCWGGNIHECLGQGAKSQTVEGCVPGSTCRDVDTGVGCVVLSCLPDSVACVNNQIGKCTADGDALSAVTLDCASQAQVCDVAGGCSPSVVDELGRTDQTCFSELKNTIHVHSTRRVTKVEVDFPPQPADVNLHWFINSTQAFVEASSVAHAGDTTASTTELVAILQAGGLYSVGVTGPAGNYCYLPGSLPLVSFGTVETMNGNGQVFAMRITTELP